MSIPSSEESIHFYLDTEDAGLIDFQIRAKPDISLSELRQKVSAKVAQILHHPDPSTLEPTLELSEGVITIGEGDVLSLHDLRQHPGLENAGRRDLTAICVKVLPPT